MTKEEMQTVLDNVQPGTRLRVRFQNDIDGEGLYAVSAVYTLIASQFQAVNKEDLKKLSVLVDRERAARKFQLNDQELRVIEEQRMLEDQKRMGGHPEFATVMGTRPVESLKAFSSNTENRTIEIQLGESFDQFAFAQNVIPGLESLEIVKH